MKHTIFTVGDRDYKLRLGTNAIVNLENKLNMCLLSLFFQEEPPQLGHLLMILHGAMQQLEHGMTMQKIYTLYDRYVEEGGSYDGLVLIISKVLQDSGFLEREENQEEADL